MEFSSAWGQKIKEIDAALTRMETGNYGKFQKCGREIGIDRLRALPATTLCINCAAARESKGRPTNTAEQLERLSMRDRDVEKFGGKE